MSQEIPPGYYRISVKALVFDETRTKFLLALSDDDVWDLPGGGLKWSESGTDCLKREIREEMGLEIDSIHKAPAYFFPVVNEFVKYAYVIYEVKLSTLDFIPSDECREVRFVTPKEAHDISVRPNVKAFLEVYT